jgi:Protein of unknown function (DUF4231)
VREQSLFGGHTINAGYKGGMVLASSVFGNQVKTVTYDCAMSSSRPIEHRSAATISKWFRRLLRGRRDELELAPIEGVAADDPVMTHLDSQIRWYDRNSQRSMSAHFRLRTTQMVIAAVIPVTQVFLGGVTARVTAGTLAAVIAIFQGVDSLHNYGEHYVSWRATTQQLWRERFLFAAAAGPYNTTPPRNAAALERLAERVDAVESQENRQWHDRQLKDGGSAQQP